jgi:hypothetical protein
LAIAELEFYAAELVSTILDLDVALTISGRPWEPRR